MIDAVRASNVAVHLWLGLVVFAAGCSAWRPLGAGQHGGPPPLCIPGASIVTTKDSAVLQRVFSRIYAAAQPDLGRLRVDAVVVRISASSALSADDGLSLCRASGRATITVSETRLARALRGRTGELDLARGVAHYLAHLAWNPTPTKVTAANQDVITHQAEELGVYYYQKAGYDCSRWENPGEYLRHVRIACNLAKQGVRPHEPPAPAQR